MGQYILITHHSQLITSHKPVFLSALLLEDRRHNNSGRIYSINGKPVERRGRKANGPTGSSSYGCQAAESSAGRIVLSCHLADAFRHLKTACPASADLAFLFEEGTTMTIPEAKAYVGKDCSVTWRDRHGKEQIMTTHIQDVTFVSHYGA